MYLSESLKNADIVIIILIWLEYGYATGTKCFREFG